MTLWGVSLNRVALTAGDEVARLKAVDAGGRAVGKAHARLAGKAGEAVGAVDGASGRPATRGGACLRHGCSALAVDWRGDGGGANGGDVGTAVAHGAGVSDGSPNWARRGDGTSLSEGSVGGTVGRGEVSR